ncbi:MAG: hypothetical protein LBG52_02745, partial [Candidatus Peribacteria bacterium]|nr:hypothetical protein [Candidatus Peribacteria bacterium]
MVFLTSTFNVSPTSARKLPSVTEILKLLCFLESFSAWTSALSSRLPFLTLTFQIPVRNQSKKAEFT